MAPVSKPPPKKSRASVSGPRPMACVECKKQKIYCSKEHPKCERCQIRSIDCVYAQPKKIKVNEHNLKSLRAKLKYYEEMFKMLPPDTITSLPGPPPSKAFTEEGDRVDEEDESEEGEDAAGDVLSDQFKQMSLYLRESKGSADNFFRIARVLSGVPGDDGSLDKSAELFYDPGALPTKKQGPSGTVALPPVDIARQYFASQYMYIGTIFSFTDTDTFEKQLRLIYHSDRPHDALDATDSFAYAKFFMILALGRLYSVNERVKNESSRRKDDPPGFEYFSHALTLLPDFHEECSLVAVETLAYVGYFMQLINRRDAAFIYVGVALRMAISLGLHQEGTGPADMDEVDREHRRRVWWSIYSLDRILTLKSGHPISILDEDIAVQMPTQLPGEADDSPVVVLRYYTELSHILGDITKLIYRRSSHTDQSLTTAVHSILGSLTRWEESLPKVLRLELDQGKLSRESISMFLHYYQCINMTVRPLLFYVVQKHLAAVRAAAQGGGEDNGQKEDTNDYAKDQEAALEKLRDWRAGLSKKTVAIISGCISAARNTLLIMSKAAEYRMVATYGYMDSEHAISAVIVLVLVCGAFPDDAANTDCLDKGLRLLQTMGELGNSYVAARYKQLAHLRSILQQPRQLHPVPASASSVEGVKGVGGAHADPLETLDRTEIAFTAENCYAAQPSPFGPLSSLGSGMQGSGPPAFLPPEQQQQQQEQQQQDQLLLSEPLAQMSDFMDPSYFGFDFAAVNTAGLFPDSSNSQDPLSDDADSHLWTKAFANPVEFDIAQLIPEADMPDYARL